MAKKTILVSKNGRYEPISASIDSDTGEISSSYPVTINTASYSGSSGLLQIYNNTIIPVWTSSISNPQEIYSGSVLSYNTVEGFGPNRLDTPGFSGDISGDLSNNLLKVRNLSNVTGGVLASSYGGTGVSSPSSGSLIKSNGTIINKSNISNEILSVDQNKNIVFRQKQQNSYLTGTIAYLYTGSVNGTTQMTWIKPTGSNGETHRYIRVVVQAGGGAGGGGSNDSGGSSNRRGGGGGGGGYADIILPSEKISSNVVVTAGSGGFATEAVNSYPGTAGGNSSFGNYITTFGGDGGLPGRLTTNLQAFGGYGYSTAGGNGGYTSYNSVGSINYNFGAPGGGQGSAFGGSNLFVSNDSVAGSNSKDVWNFYFKKYYLNGVFTEQPFPKLVSSGANGGLRGPGSPVSRAGRGGDASFGSGGGGGGEGVNPTVGGFGGHGGKGYVLIICY